MAQEKSGSGREKFVAVNAGRDTSTAIVRLNPDDLREAPDVNVTGQRDLTGQGEDEFDVRSRLEFSVNQEVETTETDVPCLSLPLASVGSRGANR